MKLGFLTLREEERLRVLYSKVVRRVFRPEKLHEAAENYIIGGFIQTWQTSCMLYQLKTLGTAVHTARSGSLIQVGRHQTECS